MSIMLILMALAVPQMLKVKKHANETSAIQTMRTIGSGGDQLQLLLPGFACPLSAARRRSQVRRTHRAVRAAPRPRPRATRQKSGYTFTVTCGSKVTINNQDVYNSFEITGIPQTVGKTGDNGYCSDENNIIKIDPAGGTNCTQDIQ